MRFVARETGAPRVGLLGYCMGGTLASIAAALAPERVAALVNLLGPIDFSHAGALGEWVSPSWFDAEAVAAAGNVSPQQMQSGFSMLRPTLAAAKWVGFLDRAHDAAQRESFFALEEWAGDNIAFPAAAYVTYIRELYQQNLLCKGEHYVAGKRVDLARITSPVMSVVATHDTICPPAAATALVELSGAREKEVLTVQGGHVGAVVGHRARHELYPKMVVWLNEHLALKSSAQRQLSA
jgi:polyhydroxyalkanoate synthase subunit PhaC